jgi:hypothetical protein
MGCNVYGIFICHRNKSHAFTDYIIVWQWGCPFPSRDTCYSQAPDWKLVILIPTSNRLALHLESWYKRSLLQFKSFQKREKAKLQKRVCLDELSKMVFTLRLSVLPQLWLNLNSSIKLWGEYFEMRLRLPDYIRKLECRPPASLKLFYCVLLATLISKVVPRSV